MNELMANWIRSTWPFASEVFGRAIDPRGESHRAPKRPPADAQLEAANHQPRGGPSQLPICPEISHK